jgi:CheY-like chemotaxis protein
MMPRMAGFDACQLIKQLCPDLPVILTSGYSEEDATARFTEGAIARFIQKPFLPAALVRLVGAAVGERRRDEGMR